MAIARRTTGKYKIRFPRTNDKNEIVQFLDDMGVECIKWNYTDRVSESMREHTLRTGDPCYAIGKYTENATKWIRICCDGYTVYFIRTSDATGFSLEREFLKETSMVTVSVTFDEIRKYIEKHFRLE